MVRNRKLAIVAILALSTLLWGTALAAHQHGDGLNEQCEYSLLPHAADVSQDLAVLHLSLTPCQTDSFRDLSYTAGFQPLFWCRAPPA